MTECYLCGRKATRECCECDKPVCKECTCFIDKDQIRYHPKPPRPFQFTHFCAPCFERDVQPHLDRYQEVAEKARAITLVYSNHKGNVPCLKRVNTLKVVKKHDDEFHAVEHMRFLAAWEGYDSVVGLETEGVQKRNYGYQTTEWNAKGYFANLNHARYRPQRD